ncbi:PaeR7I family type II restriction endonuclease [Rhodanobacter thiooxydans]|uniref:PaeR7I family type II restriction endonuclease n=1 Tax=Rhodanobacter thiooxydans TaxID=416169 RepID=UPI001B7D8EF3
MTWLTLFEECDASTRSVRRDEPHFPVVGEFRDTSYARRPRIPCKNGDTRMGPSPLPRSRNCP